MRKYGAIDRSSREEVRWKRQVEKRRTEKEKVKETNCNERGIICNS